MTLVEALIVLGGVLVVALPVGSGALGFYWGRRSRLRAGCAPSTTYTAKPSGSARRSGTLRSVSLTAWVVTGLSFIALNGIEQRALSRLSESEPDVFIATIRKLVSAGNVDRAIKFCRDRSSASALVIQAALLNVDRSDDEIRQRAEVARAGIRSTTVGAFSFWAQAAMLLLIAIADTLFGVARPSVWPGRGAPERLAAASILAAMCIALGATAEQQRVQLEAETDHALQRGLELVFANRQKSVFRGI